MTLLASGIITAEQLLKAGDIGRCELVRGELHMMAPASFGHGWIAGEIFGRMRDFVLANRLGIVTAAETGFLISRDPDTVRAPDIGFVRKDRVGQATAEGFFPGAPDVAVEVLSPRDTPGYVSDKVTDWLKAGTEEVWIVDPKNRTLTVHQVRHGAPSRSVYIESEEFIADEPLKGFRLVLRDVLR